MTELLEYFKKYDPKILVKDLDLLAPATAGDELFAEETLVRGKNNFVNNFITVTFLTKLVFFSSPVNNRKRTR